MSLKPRHKRRIFWTTLAMIGVFVMTAIAFTPMMLDMNKLKPNLQTILYRQTGIVAEIRGNVNFSLIGRTTIVAHDVVIPIGTIRSVTFTVPLRDIFNVSNARIGDEIAINGGDFKITKLESLNVARNIDVYDTTIDFLGKKYTIIRGTLLGTRLIGTVRTTDHKYDFDFSGDEFHITNKNHNLDIYGNLYSDGTARGHMSIKTDNINRWFEFAEPQIHQTIDMTANYDWDGAYGVSFFDINANGVTGDIKLLPDGERDIKLSSKNLDFDLSFLLNPTGLLYRAKYDLDFYGNLKLGTYNFKHLMIRANGTTDAFNITHIIADDITLAGGQITKDGAQNILVQMPFNGQEFTCMFSGTPNAWHCGAFTYGNITGKISVTDDTFNIYLTSPDNMPDAKTLHQYIAYFGSRGHLDFTFADMAGTIDITSSGEKIKYTYAKDKTIAWLDSNFSFLPDFMLNDIGDLKWRGNIMEFVPHSNKWFLSLAGNRFYLSGTNIKDLFPNMDLRTLRNADYVISGTYNKNNISDLTIQIAGHTFTGGVSSNSITLRAPLLNIDSFISQDFLDNYEEQSFLTNSPIMIPFALKNNVSLSADKLIYNGNEYANFVYSLKPNVQTFSITDSERGNLFIGINKENSTYAIMMQFGKFVSHGTLLSQRMPLNVRDTTITGEVNMTTTGHIAHDLEYNLQGSIDLSFDGGYIMGIGTDRFYASAKDINSFNAEYALSDALDGGETIIKKMHIAGIYDRGNFKTDSPFTLYMRHTDAIGNISITNGMMSADINMIMRGTSPEPATINLKITPGGAHQYSLFDIMRNFDATYMQTFVTTHSKF